MSDDADFVHAITREGLATRLEPLIVDARSILDLGPATGPSGRLLRKRFRRAHVVAVDLNSAVLEQARDRESWFSRSSFVRADAERLPFASEHFDIVIANQLLPWIPEPPALFAEVARVLKKGGVFAFATLGPSGPPFDQLADMHDVGDGLVRAGLRDPVLDIDRLTVRYDDPGKLRDDLVRLGPFTAPENATPEGGLSLDLELVYGHCWGGGARKDPGAVRIDANRIPLRR